MKKIICIIITSFLLMTIMGAITHAQQITQKIEKETKVIVIVLKNSEVVKGEFLSQDDQSVTIIETERGTITILKKFILETTPPLETFSITMEEVGKKQIQEKQDEEPIISKKLLKKRSPITLYLSGSYSFINGDDLNRVIVGKKKMYSDANDYFDWNELKNSCDISFEVIYNISKHFGLGIGVGYITANSKGEYGWVQSDGDYNDYTRDYKINSWVLSGNIHYNIPLGKIFTINLTGGGDFYLGKLKHQMNRDWDYWYSVYRCYIIWPWLICGWVNVHSQGDYQVNEDMSCNTFGFHGGIGLDAKISSNLSFVVQGLYRYIEFKNYFGTYEYKSGTTTSSEEGYLWFIDGDYPGIYIDEHPPSDARKAVLNLSGFSIRTGVKIRF